MITSSTSRAEAARPPAPRHLSGGILSGMASPPLRVCDLCGGVDGAPRHVIANTAGGVDIVPPPTDEIIAAVVAAAPDSDRARLLRDLMDTTATDRHIDCCALAGCPLPADDPFNCANGEG